MKHNVEWMANTVGEGVKARCYRALTAVCGGREMTQMQTTWRDVDVSAYVDGELDPAKQVAFEAALAQNHLLRQKVKEMREVVVLIKAAPLREPPRNYLLTPAMVATKAPQRRAVQRPGISLLFMRLATSLAAVAFVVTDRADLCTARRRSGDVDTSPQSRRRNAGHGSPASRYRGSYPRSRVDAGQRTGRNDRGSRPCRRSHAPRKK